MKRVIALVLLLSGVMALFAFNVYAENTYVRQLRNYSNSISSVSLTYSATAAQFDYVTESTLSGGMYSPVLITVRFTNNGSNDIKIANSYVDLTFTTYSEVSGFDCYTSDLMVQMVKNGNDTPRYNIVASNGYSYGGHIIIPSHSSMYLVFEVDIAAHYDTSSAQVVSPSLDAVLVSVNSSDVTTGDYPTTGSIPEQLDELETYVAQIAGYSYANGQSLATITTLLNDIKNQIRYTGTYQAPQTSAYASFTYSNQDVDPNQYDRFIVYPSYLLTYDFEISGNNLYESTFKRYVIKYVFQLTVRDNYTYYNCYTSIPISSDNNHKPYVVSVESNLFDAAYIQGNNLFLRSNLINNNTVGYYLLPKGQTYAVVTIYYDVPYDYNPVFSTPSGPITWQNKTVFNGYIPSSDINALRDIRNKIQEFIDAYTNVTTSSSISSNSNTLNNTESQVHQQEQLYFQQNAQAILDTGLSNYRFNTEQSNGIGAVSIDFTALWNALGSWNSVYVFALTLTIALTILRHAPNAISTARRRNYDHNDRGS